MKTLNEVNTQFNEYMVLQYAADGNKVVKHNIEMQLIKDNLYKGENKDDSGWNYETCKLYAFYPNYDIGIEIGTFPVDTELNKVVETFEHSIFVSDEKFISGLDSLVGNGGFIGAIHIELAKYIKPENVSKYRIAKAAFHRKRDLEYQQKQREQEENDKKYCEEKNKQAEEIVAKIIEKFKGDGEIVNDTVEIYKSRYTSSSYSVINHIARMYNVNIPLKVQGWINEHLVAIRIKDGEINGYTHHKGHKSTTIFKYMEQLIKAINTETVSE
jgi:hypothetical protein